MSEQITEFRENELPLTHTFSEGVYAREIFMPKGMAVVGHVHNTTHLNMVSQGSALLYIDGKVSKITAPFTFESKAGCRKILFILEDMFWTTVHITNETDVATLEDTLVDMDASTEEEIGKLISDFNNKMKLIGVE